MSVQAEGVCKQILLDLIKQGFTHQVRKTEIIHSIMNVRHCMDYRTINGWFKALEAFGFIEPNATTPVFNMNLTKFPELESLVNEATTRT